MGSDTEVRAPRAPAPSMWRTSWSLAVLVRKAHVVVEDGDRVDLRCAGQEAGDVHVSVRHQTCGSDEVLEGGEGGEEVDVPDLDPSH